LALLADRERRTFEEKMRQEGKSEFQEAALAFEDGFYSLTEGRKEILQAGFEAIRAHDIQNPWSEKLILALVRSEPMKYAAELGLTIADTSLASDGSWQATAQYSAGWTSPDSQSGNWQPARVIAEAQQFSGYGAKRLWAPSTTLDSTGVEAGSDSTQVGVAGEPVEEVYFRKTVEIRGLPVAGQIQIAADDSYHLFVNGEFIAQVPHIGRDSVATRVHDVVNFLKAGANVIALHVQDTDRSGGALEALLFLKSLPGWEQRQRELQIQKEKQDESLILERGTNPQ
jgi:hypothetical protein